MSDWLATAVLITPVAIALGVSELAARRRRRHDEDIEPVSDECLGRLRGDESHRWNDELGRLP